VDYHYLISKFFAGEITDDELNLLKSWLNMDPENKRIFKEENELWQASSIHANAEHFNTDTAWNTIFSKLDFGKNVGNVITIINRTKFRILIAAAVLAFLMVIGGITLWILERGSLNRNLVATTLIVTKDGEKATLFLADSSKVILNSGSSIEYNGQYNIKDRLIKFSGEAFFDVTTNPEKPFIVQLDQMRITATGTRFNIFSYL
jgi:ferric-dicitrate binding protein FerR (iron transport regulator)